MGEGVFESVGYTPAVMSMVNCAVSVESADWNTTLNCHARRHGTLKLKPDWYRMATPLSKMLEPFNSISIAKPEREYTHEREAGGGQWQA